MPPPPPCARRASSPEPRRSGAAIDAGPRFPFPALRNARTASGATPHPPGGARGSEQAPLRSIAGRRPALSSAVRFRIAMELPRPPDDAIEEIGKPLLADPLGRHGTRLMNQCVRIRSNLLPDYAQGPACDPRRRKPRGRPHESPSFPQRRESGSIEIFGFPLSPRLRQDEGG